jgi:hypothetical protein
MVKISEGAEGERFSMMDVRNEQQQMGASVGLRNRYPGIVFIVGWNPHKAIFVVGTTYTD